MSIKIQNKLYRTSLIFVLALVGNASVLNFDATFLIYLLLMVSVISLKFNFLSLRFLTFLSLLFLFDLTNQLNNDFLFFSISIKSLLIFLVLFKCKNITNQGIVVETNSDKLTVKLLICIVIIQFPVYTFESGRLYGLFGPNILYRIYGVLYLIWFFVPKTRFEKNYINNIYISFITIMLLLTGSVTSILIILIPLVFIFKKKLQYIIYVVIFGLAFYIYFPIEELQIINRLAKKLTSEHGFLGYRGTAWEYILNYEITTYGYDYNHFEKIWVPGHMYSHNFFIDLIYFGGISGIIISIFVFFSIFVSIFNLKDSILHIVYLIIFIGSMLSGNVNDNFALIPLSFIIMYKKIGFKYENIRLSSTTVP